jgi:hypothetical protein
MAEGDPGKMSLCCLVRTLFKPEVKLVIVPSQTYCFAMKEIMPLKTISLTSVVAFITVLFVVLIVILLSISSALMVYLH